MLDGLAQLDEDVAVEQLAVKGGEETVVNDLADLVRIGPWLFLVVPV